MLTPYLGTGGSSELLRVYVISPASMSSWRQSAMKSQARSAQTPCASVAMPRSRTSYGRANACGKPPNRQRARRNELGLRDRPREDPANSGQVLPCPRDPIARSGNTSCSLRCAARRDSVQFRSARSSTMAGGIWVNRYSRLSESC